MRELSFSDILDILQSRRTVYDLDTDSRIREAADRFTARAFFEMMARADFSLANRASQLQNLLRELGGDEVTYLIGFDSGKIPKADPDEDDLEPAATPVEHYLRLVFSNEDAAYYQFSVFPELDAAYVLGAKRKRTGAVQHICVTLRRPEALQTFIEACRRNPHFVRVEESTKEDFDRAPSNGV